MEVAQEEEIRRIQLELEKTLAQINRDIPVYLFTNPGENDVFSDAARQGIRFFRQLTDRVKLKEFNLGHELAVKLGVHGSPTIVFDPDNYNIQWLGAPMGEEGKIFLEALLRIGTQRAGLNEQSAAVLSKINAPRNIKVFVSPSCPYCPQQALNALKAAVARPELISLEIIDIQANPDLADSYAAHSVPQAFVDDILIALGAQTEELFMSSLEKMEQQTVFIPETDAEEITTDLVIVGGGPAGLSAGIYAARSGLNSVILEKGVLGGQIALTPVVENYPGMKQVGGKTLVDIMVTHALEYVNIFPGEEVVDIKPGNPILVQTSRRKFWTKSVLLTTGATHRHLGVPGENRFSGRGVSYCSTCDGPLFKGRKVLMVGGGNSAVTEALHLKNMGVDVTLVHRRSQLKAQKILADKLAENGIDVLYNHQVVSIDGKDIVEKVVLKDTETGRTTEMAVNGVFMAIGYIPATGLAEKLGIELTDEGYVKQENHRTNIPGIYTAGDVAGGYKQIVTAAGQGSEAALAVFEDIINPYWKS